MAVHRAGVQNNLPLFDNTLTTENYTQEKEREKKETEK